MKKFVVIAIAIIVAAGIWYSISKGKSDSVIGTQDSIENGTTEAMVLPAGKSVTNPADFMAKGGQYTCSFDMDNVDLKSSGKFSIEGRKVRGEYTSTVKKMGVTVTAQVLFDDQNSYMWTNSGATGVKVPLTEDVKKQIDFSQYGAGTVWDCRPAKLAANTFVPPADIQFMTAPAFKK